jgi:hypothetical protein
MKLKRLKHKTKQPKKTQNWGHGFKAWRVCALLDSKINHEVFVNCSFLQFHFVLLNLARIFA